MIYRGKRRKNKDFVIGKIDRCLILQIRPWWSVPDYLLIKCIIQSFIIIITVKISLVFLIQFSFIGVYHLFSNKAAVF